MKTLPAIAVTLLMSLVSSSIAQTPAGNACTGSDIIDRARPGCTPIGPAPYVPVLIYHRVTTAEPAGQTVISPRMMTAHLDRIQKLGYNTITIGELENFMRAGAAIPPKSVVLTFDDGFETDRVAAALLKERRMKATFYFMSGAWQSAMYLSKEQMREIAVDFEIGAHTHTHFMEWEGKMDKADERVMYGEAVLSKVLLEDIIGKPVTTFSWPFGYVRPHMLKHLKRLGYTSTVNVDATSVNTRDGNPMFIQRLNIDGGCTADQLQTILESGKHLECK